VVSNYKLFLSSIEKQVLPVYLFCGAEDFLIDDALRQIKKLILSDAQTELNAHLFYAEDTDSAHIINEAETMPFLASKRLIVVRNAAKLAASDIDNMVSYVEKPADFSCLILVDPSIKSKHKLYKAVSVSGMVVDFKALRARELDLWLENKVTSNKKKLEPGACRVIRDRVGEQLRELDRVVQTLCAYVGQRDRINIADVEEVVGQTHLLNIFKLVDAVGAKKADVALKILRQLQIQGIRETHCLNMLARQLRQIDKYFMARKAGLSEMKTAGVLGVPPYIVKKIKAQAGNFNIAELKQGFKFLLDADKKIKTGQLKPWLVLECLVLRLCSVVS